MQKRHNLKHDPDIHHRRSIRLKGYDYAQPGAYFVTICTRDRECIFCGVADSQTRLTKAGEIVRRCWEDIPRNFSHVVLDAAIIMPNHVHGIITITEFRRGLINQTPTSRTLTANQPATNQTSATPTLINGDHTTPPDWILMKNDALVLGKIIRYFKARTTKIIHDQESDTFHWQRNYYEHIIRNDEELNAISQYILNNPANWPTDENYRA